MKSSFYLKHDLDAREDDKMRALLMKFGARGYGIYWMIAEDLYRNAGRIARDYAAMAWTYHEPAKDIKAIVEAFDLFYDDRGKIACRRVDRDLAGRAEASEEGRSAILRRKRPDGSLWVRDRDLVAPYNDPSTRRGEERKGEEGKEKTAAPTAADLRRELSTAGDKLGISRILKKTDGELLDVQLPFEFGDIPKGRRIIDVDPVSAQAILDKMPRMGGELERALLLRVKIKNEELLPKLRR